MKSKPIMSDLLRGGSVMYEWTLVKNLDTDKGNENFAKCCLANGYELLCLIPYDRGVK